MSSRAAPRLPPALPALLAVLASAPLAARAQPLESTPPTAVEQLQALIDGADPIFARYVVAPVATVLFWDLAFFDDGRSVVRDVAYDAEGRALSVGQDGRLLVWEAGRVERAHDLESGPLAAIAPLEGSGSEAVVALVDGSVRRVDLDSGATVTRYPGLVGAPSALAVNAAQVVVGSDEGRLRVWDLDGGPGEDLFKAPGASIRALAVRGSTVAFSTNGELRVGQLRVGGGTMALRGHRRGVDSVAFGPDDLLASGGADGRVLLHRLGEPEPAAVVDVSQDPAVDLAFPEARRILVGRPGGIQVLERDNGVFEVARLLKAKVNAFAVSGDLALVARDQGQVRVFDVEDGRRVSILAGHATEIALPIIVVWLVLGATFFTLRFGFVNIRAFRHAIAVTRGQFDDHHDEGDVSHFQALAMALSATVGLGNIAGVAVAVSAGGPGAVFWMIVAGFLGMSSKFAECTLGQMYRTTDRFGKVSGGPMHYLERGLAEMNMAGLGRTLSVLFAVLCIFGSLGGGNMFQANQSYAQVASVVPIFQGEIGSLVYGLLLSGLVGVVIIGGIDRIGQVASFIVPFMVGIYMLAAFFIVITNFTAVPAALGEIVSSAFTPGAAFGGALGVMVTGFRRAAFSNEAGVGSASIAHSAAATKEPVREGIVALLEPFIDTIVVCTTTALVLVITGAYETEADGVVMTSSAFATVLPWFPKVLTLAVFLFAFSTMISWSYYGERCWTFLFGSGSTLIYKIIFVGAVVLGSVIQLGSVLDFSDLMILAMAFPNILGVVLLSGKVHARLADYLARLRTGAMRPGASAGE